MNILKQFEDSGIDFDKSFDVALDARNIQKQSQISVALREISILKHRALERLWGVRESRVNGAIFLQLTRHPQSFPLS